MTSQALGRETRSGSQVRDLPHRGLSQRRPARRAEVDVRRQRLRERLRVEWIHGAEKEWRRLSGRPMTAEELARVLRPYPGDI